MSNDNEPLKVDDLQYDWPMNVLGYESRALLGMSMQELLIVALPAVFLLMLTESLPLGGVAMGNRGQLASSGVWA